MINFKKVISSVLLLLIIALSLCGCASGDNKSIDTKNSISYDGVQESLDISGDVGENSAKKATDVSQNRKIIEYVDFTIETKTFDSLIEKINSAVEKSGGYAESSQIGGNSYLGTENRTAELKIRIPNKEKSDFSDFLSKNGNVINKSVTTDDVTDQYIDTESRIKALTIEKETLEGLLSKSSNVSDTLTVYEKLTDVIAEIESYQSKLNQMDSLIEYTTFTVYINEVQKETSVKKQNWFVKTWNGLADNFLGVGNGILDFLSFIISAIPYWILLGIIVFVLIVIIRRRKNKKSKDVKF